MAPEGGVGLPQPALGTGSPPPSSPPELPPSCPVGSPVLASEASVSGGPDVEVPKESPVLPLVVVEPHPAKPHDVELPLGSWVVVPRVPPSVVSSEFGSPVEPPSSELSPASPVSPVDEDASAGAGPQPPSIRNTAMNAENEVGLTSTAPKMLGRPNTAHPSCSKVARGGRVCGNVVARVLASKLERVLIRVEAWRVFLVGSTTLLAPRDFLRRAEHGERHRHVHARRGFRRAHARRHGPPVRGGLAGLDRWLRQGLVLPIQWRRKSVKRWPPKPRGNVLSPSSHIRTKNDMTLGCVCGCDSSPWTKLFPGKP